MTLHLEGGWSVTRAQLYKCSRFVEQHLNMLLVMAYSSYPTRPRGATKQGGFCVWFSLSGWIILWGPVWGPSHTHLKLSRWSREYTILIKFTEDAKCGVLAMLTVLMSNFCLGHSCFCTKITPAQSILPCYYHRGDKGSLEHSKFWCKILKYCECSLLLLYSRCTNVPCVS